MKVITTISNSNISSFINSSADALMIGLNDDILLFLIVVITFIFNHRRYYSKKNINMKV